MSTINLKIEYNIQLTADELWLILSGLKKFDNAKAQELRERLLRQRASVIQAWTAQLVPIEEDNNGE